MEVIGGVSGIFTLVDTGFSLAKALNTYISEVSESRDDLVGLCADIDSTFNNLKELANVVQKNEQTQVWSDHGLANARKCAHDADVVIKKMRKLVQKGGVSVLTTNVEPEQIDIQKFRRLLWPMYKGELEVRRRELQAIKLDIVIAYTSYNAKAADTSSARQQAENDLPRLQHAKASMRKDLRRARRNRKSRTHSPDYHIRHHSPVGSRRSHSKSTFNDAASNASSDIYGAPGEIIYECVEDVVKDFEIWQREKEEAQKAAIAERKKIQEEAVERWKQEQREEAEKQRVEIQAHRDRVRDELARQQIAPQRIEEILNHVYPFPSSGQLTTTPSHVQADIESLVSSGNSEKTGSASLWSKFGRRRASSIASQGRRDSIIPSLLQDPTSPGGLAQLKALYFQRMLGPEGERVQQIDVDIPEQWLLQKILFKDTKTRNEPKSNSIWRDFAQLPDDYRYCITNELKRKQIPTNSHAHGEWVLIYAEPQRRGGSRRKFLNGRKNDVIGVYIVLKKVPRVLPTVTQIVDKGKDTEEKAPEIKTPVKIPVEVPELKVPQTQEPLPEVNVKFTAEPQHASVYTPREEPEPEPIQLRHASRRSQSQGEASVSGDRPSRSRSPVPAYTRKARFSDDPVTGTAYVDRWDQESQSTLRPPSRSDHISPVPPLIAYPSMSRSSSRRRSLDRNSTSSAYHPYIPDPYYEERKFGSQVPPPPGPIPYYSEGDEILVDTLGTAWDNRRRSSFDSIGSFGSRNSSPRRHSRKPTYSRSSNDFELELELKKLEEELRRTKENRSRSYRDRDAASNLRRSRYPTESQGEIIIRRDITTERERLPTRSLDYKPPSRRSTFDSEQSQSRYNYGREHRRGAPASGYSIETHYPRGHSSYSSRVTGPPGPIVIREDSRPRINIYERTRPLSPTSSDNDDDTVSLSSYDGGETGEKRNHRRTSATDKKIAQSMLEQLTNKNIAVPFKKSTPPKSPTENRVAKPVEQSRTFWPAETKQDQTVSEEPRIVEIPTDNMTPLEEAQLKLERLKNKLAIATATGDIQTASDLKYYAIPDQQHRIKQLGEQEENAKRTELNEHINKREAKRPESNIKSHNQGKKKVAHVEAKRPESNIKSHNEGKKKVAHVESDEDSDGGGTPQRRVIEELDTDDGWGFGTSKPPRPGTWFFNGQSAATKKPGSSSDHEQQQQQSTGKSNGTTWDDNDWRSFWGPPSTKKKKKKAKAAQVEDAENGTQPRPETEVIEVFEQDDDWLTWSRPAKSGGKKKKKAKKPPLEQEADDQDKADNDKESGSLGREADGQDQADDDKRPSSPEAELPEKTNGETQDKASLDSNSEAEKVPAWYEVEVVGDLHD